MKTNFQLKQIDWLKNAPFFAMHLGCIAAFFVPFAWKWVGLAVLFYYIRMFGITAGYHRYFAHRSFKTSRVMQVFLAILGLLAIQKGPLWWAAHHRQHHRYSDLDGDIHSPLKRGFWWSHVLWILVRDYEETQFKLIPDYAKYPELVWLNKYFLVPGIVMAGLLLLIGGLPAFVWCFVVSTVALYHGTFVINSLAHVFGRRRFQTTDTSRNSLILSLVTMGEGWHNNHHHYMHSVRQGFYWWEIDTAYYALKLMSWLGLVWDLKAPPAHVYEEAGRVAIGPVKALAA